MLLGWYIVAPALVPPVSALLSYWMAVCCFMGLKRFSEFRDIDNPTGAVAYRRGFVNYTE